MRSDLACVRQHYSVLSGLTCVLTTCLIRLGMCSDTTIISLYCCVLECVLTTYDCVVRVGFCSNSLICVVRMGTCSDILILLWGLFVMCSECLSFLVWNEF